MAVVLTAWRRPGYTRKALQSWQEVACREYLKAFTVCLDPSDRQDEMLAVTREFPWAHVKVNPVRYGVLMNPKMSISSAFTDNQVPFAIVADDDMLVSDDILQYFRWAADRFAADKSVAAVCAHTPEPAPQDADQNAVCLLPRYRCWVWGTWIDRWANLLEPTWDGDYSSGEPAGYDWNIDLRVIPQNNMRCVFPLASRSQNIGKFEGVHASPGEFADTANPSFREHREMVTYTMVLCRNGMSTSLLQTAAVSMNQDSTAGAAVMRMTARAAEAGRNEATEPGCRAGCSCRVGKYRPGEAARHRCDTRLGRAALAI